MRSGEEVTRDMGGESTPYLEIHPGSKKIEEEQTKMHGKKQAKHQLASGLQSLGRKRDMGILNVNTGKSGSPLCRTGPHPSGATNLLDDSSEMVVPLAERSNSIFSHCGSLSIPIRHISHISSWLENLFLKLNYPRDLRLGNAHRSVMPLGEGRLGFGTCEDTGSLDTGRAECRWSSLAQPGKSTRRNSLVLDSNSSVENYPGVR